MSIIGLGALGILFGNHLSKKMPKDDLTIIADESRIKKYEDTHLYCNGECCSFNYITPEEKYKSADLVIFAVKSVDLKTAINAVRNHIGKNTIILSLLNGISSEELIGESYGIDKIVYCVAQGMDAVKVENKLVYYNMGMLCIGVRESSIMTHKLKKVVDFFEKMDIPFEVESNIIKRLWGKFMINVGLNQTVAMYESNYGEIQKNGEARNMMIAAMREVIALSQKEGIDLTEEDLEYWLNVVSSLNPNSKPSMRQDMEAKRYSEVESFAGTVLRLAKKHDIPTPVNQKLYDWIKYKENTY